MPSTRIQPDLASVQGHRRTPPTSRCASRRLTIEIQDSPGALARILTVLLRRRCVVTRVDFVARDRHRPGRLVLGYDAPAQHADRTVEWLRALVDVIAVEALESAGPES